MPERATWLPAGCVASPLLKRFVENRQVLIRARRAILGHDRQEVHGIDAEWLADNFHIVDDVLREVRQDLPRGYDVVLPKLGVAPLSGFPRVYALAVALVAHTDSELDELKITRFVQAFQEVVPLTIGELWALPTMLRLVLLENFAGLPSRCSGAGRSGNGRRTGLKGRWRLLMVRRLIGRKSIQRLGWHL